MCGLPDHIISRLRDGAFHVGRMSLPAGGG